MCLRHIQGYLWRCSAESAEAGKRRRQQEDLTAVGPFSPDPGSHGRRFGGETFRIFLCQADATCAAQNYHVKTRTEVPRLRELRIRRMRLGSHAADRFREEALDDFSAG